MKSSNTHMPIPTPGIRNNLVPILSCHKTTGALSISANQMTIGIFTKTRSTIA